MKKTYHYKGEVAVEVPGAGVFEPDETKEVEIEINNPLFEEVTKKQEAKKEGK